MQAEIGRAVGEHRFVAVRSCHGAGKTWTAATVALQFLYTHFPSIVITTAPTARQVKSILWKEMRLAHQKARVQLGGRVLQSEIQLDAHWWAVGFATSDYNAERFQGFHEDWVLVIVDEAAGVSEDIYTGVDGVLTSEHAHRLEIGNPTDAQSRFARSFKTPRVHKMRISAWDTPNFTTFGITREHTLDGSWESKITGELPYPKLVTPYWVAERLDDWGADSPLWISRVEGEFPQESEDALIKLQWVEGAQARLLEPADGDELELAVDVARFGNDETVIGSRKGPRVRILKGFRKRDTMATAGEVAHLNRVLKPARIKIDSVGIGAGVYDRLREQGLPVVEMNAGAGAYDKEKFLNARAEWFSGLSDRFQSGDIDIPTDPVLQAQLCSLRAKYDSRGRLVLESKDDMRRRGFQSPDRADVLAMLYARGQPAVEAW